MRPAQLLIVLALAATAALAQQPIYRSVMPDGRIIYGDKPAPGAKESSQVNLPPPNLSTPAQPAASSPAPQQQAVNAADALVRDARRTLEAAKAALEAGREPQEGEREGTTINKGRSTGSTRASDAYVQRVKALEDAVAAAQKNLDDALARRNAAR